MKLGLLQCVPTDGDEDRAFERIAAALAAGAACGAELIVFPELMLPGYNRPDLHIPRAQPQGGQWETGVSALCAEHGCGACFGWAERAGDKVYNAASVFDAQGEKRAHYRKVQLFGEMERQSFVAGDALTVFEWQGQKVGLLICYDVEFAHHVCALADRGVTLVLVPTANPAGFEAVSQRIVPARAFETAMTVVYANYCGEERGLAFGGQSLVAAPDGSALVSAGRGEALMFADLSLCASLDPAKLSTQAADRRTLP